MNQVKTPYAILELGTGYMDGWYFMTIKEVKEIARGWDELRPEYPHRIIISKEKFSIHPPVITIADAYFGRLHNKGGAA